MHAYMHDRNIMSYFIVRGSSEEIPRKLRIAVSLYLYNEPDYIDTTVAYKSEASYTSCFTE